MKIELIAIGKTDSKELESLLNEYKKRLSRFTDFSFTVLPDIKNSKGLSQVEQKKKEAELILQKLSSIDKLILLCERGRQYSSEELAEKLEKDLSTSHKKLVFAIGGPYGFSDEIYQRAAENISLSKLTFSHQMVRLFFTEQLYRAFTIINNLPYHHK